LPISATMFGLYGKVKRTIGLADYIDDDDDENQTGYGTGSWREGRDLIERELNGTSIGRSRDVAGPGGIASGGAATRATPVRSIPGPSSRPGGPTTPLGTSPNIGRVESPATAASSRRVGQRQHARLGDDEDEDDNFFSQLGTRIKNTVDTIDTPNWLQEIVKKPKWMGGDDDEGGQASGSGSNNSDIRRWFGGGNDGRIRL